MTGCELCTKSGISESAVEEGWEEDGEALEGVNSCPAGPCWEPGTRPGRGRGLPCLPSLAPAPSLSHWTELNKLQLAPTGRFAEG